MREVGATGENRNEVYPLRSNWRSQDPAAINIKSTKGYRTSRKNWRFLKDRTRSGIINWMLFMAPTGEQQEGALRGLGHGVVGNQTESECFVTFSVFTERLHHGVFTLNK